MPITNTWSVRQMDCYPEYEGETDVVFTVHWMLVGGDGTYVGVMQGSCGLTLNPEATFTPYADLTQDQVIGWVQDAIGPGGVAVLEANVAKQIEDQINPPVVSPPLPWAAPTPV